MIRFLAAAAAVLSIAASPAHADRYAADRCAATLPPPTRMIYNQSLPAVLGGQSIKDAVTGSTRSMVMSGSLPRADARPAAEAAAGCLRQLR